MIPGRRRSRTRIWVAGAVGFLILLFFVFGPRLRQPALGSKAVLNDGRELVLAGVTFGHEHRMKYGRIAARFLQSLPDTWFPEWRWVRALDTGVGSGTAQFSEPHVVLWFCCPPTPKAPAPPRRPAPSSAKPPRIPAAFRHFHAAPFLRWKVVAPDGTVHGGSVTTGVPGGSFENLLPIPIDSFPRRLSRFTVQLFESTRGSDSGDDAVLIGEFVIRNPNPSTVPGWVPGPMPDRRESEGLTCVLEDFRRIGPAAESSLEKWPPPDAPESTRLFRHALAIATYHSFLSTRGGFGGGGEGGGSSWVFRDDSSQIVASFAIEEPGNSPGGWEVRQFLLLDPTRNVSYPSSVQWRQAGPGKYRLDCRSIPLWSDEPAWKLQLALVRLGAPPSHRIVSLQGIPFPPGAGTRQLILTTNLFGWAMTLHSVGAEEPGPTLGSALQLNEPGLFLAFDRNGAGTNAVVSPMVVLLDIRDDQGRAIPKTTFHPDNLSDLRRWHLRFTGRDFSGTNNVNGVQSVDLTLAFPEERHFEFIVAAGKGR